MTTNLWFANAGIPVAAESCALSVSQDNARPLANLFGGNRAQTFRAAAAVTGDQRVQVVAVAPARADFLFIAGAKTLQRGGVTAITLKGHTADDYAAATTVHAAASFASATLVGPNGEDYLATFAKSAAYRYWWVNFTSATTANAVPHQKLFFGEAFDPGQEPQTLSEVRTRAAAAQRASASVWTLAYDRMPRAKAQALFELVARRRQTDPVLAFTTGYHGLLSDYRAVLCRCTAFSYPPSATDFNPVSTVLEEMI